MECIIYTSRASMALGSDEVFRIIETSARNNPSRDVTGFLIFHRERFLQLVEGETPALDELLAVLKRDSRHRDLAVLHRKPTLARCFPNWRMRRLGSSVEGFEDVLRLLASHDIGERCMELVEEFLTYAEYDSRKRSA